MVLSSEDLKILTQYSSYCDDNHDCEFEVVFTGKTSLTRDAFVRTLNYCRIKASEDNWNITLERDKTLDIFILDYRISVHGTENIEKYIRYESLKDIPEEKIVVIKKKFLSRHKTDFECCFNIKSELQIQVSEIKELFDKNWEKYNKHFRLKNRYSYLFDERYSVDITVVKSSSKDVDINYKSFQESNMINIKEHFEIEIEYKQKKKPDNHLETKLEPKKLSVLIQQILCCIKNSWNLLHSNEQEHLVSLYKKLLPMSPTDQLNSVPLHTIYDKYYLSPQVVTLDQKRYKNLIRNQSEYTVTTKTDGNRMLGFIADLQNTDHAELYLFDNKTYEFHSTGCLFQKIAANSIVDGELVRKFKNDDLRKNVKIAHYIIFDCYYFQGKDIRQMNLLDNLNDSRLDKARKLLIYITTIRSSHIINSQFHIEVKKFYKYNPENIRQCFQDIITSKYENDGLIFTPIEKVGGIEKYDTKQKFVKSGGTFERLYKWKSHDSNSIDFKIKIGKEVQVVQKIGEDFVEERVKKCHLTVRYSGNWKHYGSFSRNEFLIETLNKNQITTSYDKCSTSIQNFIPFNPIEKDAYKVNIPLNNQQIRCKTKSGWNGDIIKDGDIVEMVYDINARPRSKWYPIRIRHDKTKPNHFTTAENIWQTYYYPVTADMLMHPNLLLHDNKHVYYFNSERLKENYRIFHRNVVKKKLLEEVFNAGGKRLLDLCCGKGGDIPRYSHFNLSVIGIDDSIDNLHNPIDGAYRRLWMNSHKDSDLSDITFLKGNVEESFKNKDTFDKMYSDDALKIFSKKNSFDAASIFFAIHYFFKNQHCLRKFLGNIADNVKVGGYVVGCCYDGAHIYKMIGNDSDTLTFKKKNKEILRITPKYDVSSDLKTFSENPYNKKIGIFVHSIGIEHDEYLVNFNVLENEMKNIGFTLLDSKNFKEYYDDQTNDCSLIFMEDEDKQISFLNRSFVFKRVKDTVKAKIILTVS